MSLSAEKDTDKGPITVKTVLKTSTKSSKQSQKGDVSKKNTGGEVVSIARLSVKTPSASGNKGGGQQQQDGATSVTSVVTTTTLSSTFSHKQSVIVESAGEDWKG